MVAMIDKFLCGHHQLLLLLKWKMMTSGMAFLELMRITGVTKNLCTVY
uniref:Uncharacterized protein n=1 Tax=Arundo donax TaxID=35708 RepID=A0A0A9B7R0_ARUDO